jgi:hypothetical protein
MHGMQCMHAYFYLSMFLQTDKERNRLPLASLARFVFPSGHMAFRTKSDIPTYLMGTVEELDAFHELVPAPNESYTNLFWPGDTKALDEFIAKKKKEERELKKKQRQLLISIGLQKRWIQEYFWLELFDVIARSYKTYSDAAAEAVNGSSDYEPTPMNVINLDRELLCRVPELADEIATQDENLAALRAELQDDEGKFGEQAKIILSEARLLPPDDPHEQLRSNSYERVTKAYDECLRNWFDARNKLTDEHLSQKLKEMTDNPELPRIKAMGSVLKNILKIRRIYAVLEIYAPVVFAVGTILYVWVS